MARKIQAGPNQRGIALDDGLVIKTGDLPVVVSDVQFARLASLVSSGALVDLGSTSDPVTDGSDSDLSIDEIESRLSDTFSDVVDDETMARLERETSTQVQRYNVQARARIDDAGVPFTEPWTAVVSSNRDGWFFANAGIGSNRLVYTSGGSGAVAMRAAPTTPAWFARVAFRTTGTPGKYAYFGVSSEAPSATPNATNIMSAGVGSANNNAAINRGASITGAASVVPKALAALPAGNWVMTWYVDADHCSFSIQADPSSQVVYWVRIAKSQMPGGVVNSITLATNETVAANMTFGPVIVYGAPAIPPAAYRTVGGVGLFGAGKPLHICKADPVTGFGRIISVPGDLDSRVPAPVVLFLHQSITGTASSPWNATTDARMANVTAALEAAGYIVMASDNGPATTAGGTQDRFANQSSLDDNVSAVIGVRKMFATGAVMLLGTSMGSFIAQNLLVQRKLGGIAAVATISGGSDLKISEQDPAFTALLRAAYGNAVSSADFATKVVGYNPIDQDPRMFRGVPQRFYVGTSDVTAPPALQVTPFVAKVGPYVPESQVVSGAVGHLDSSLYQGSNLVGFFDSYR